MCAYCVNRMFISYVYVRYMLCVDVIYVNLPSMCMYIVVCDMFLCVVYCVGNVCGICVCFMCKYVYMYLCMYVCIERDCCGCSACVVCVCVVIFYVNMLCCMCVFVRGK